MTLIRPLARSETGLALVILLVVVLALTLVGLAMADNVIRETQIAVNQYTAARARYLAEAGIADAAARLSQSNTWVGPITQSLGAGSYTVQVDTTVSNSALKTIVSTGTVTSGAPSGANQTIRETVLVLPKAFSKAMVSNTVLTISNSSTTPTVQNTVLRQLGTIHANNLLGESPSVSIIGSGTTVTGQVTASSGTVTIDPAATCVACTPANTLPTIPFPTFNWNTYITLAQNNPNYPGPSHSPCPAVNPTGTYFTSQAAFDTCVAAITPDAQGFRTIRGVVFFNAPSLDGNPFFLPNAAAGQVLRIIGTLAVYFAGGGCSVTQPCGDIEWDPPVVGTNNLVFTAQGGEPAIMAAGSFSTPNGPPGPISITGLVYLLANTTDPTVNAPADPGYAFDGGTPTTVTITGTLVGQRLNAFSSNSLTYDPSIFFAGLPSGLNTPAAPFVLLPFSWSSGR